MTIMEPLFPGMTHHENLKADNEVLRLRLETELGVKTQNTGEVGPAIENIWLRFIYEHAQARRTCGVIKLYDFIGRPEFVPLEQLDPNMVAAELGRLCALLVTHSVIFEWICQYEDAVLYRFVTTELFEVEVDNLRMPGMVHHFTYEEFHMNNRHEVERIAVNLVKSIYHHEWRPEYDALWIAQKIACNGVDCDFDRFNSIILEFQRRHAMIEIDEITVDDIFLDPSETKGYLKVSLRYDARLHDDEKVSSRLGSCVVHVAKDVQAGQWMVVAADLPGIMAAL